jgi:hypothetical protein
MEMREDRRRRSRYCFEVLRGRALLIAKDRRELEGGCRRNGVVSCDRLSVVNRMKVVAGRKMVAMALSGRGLWRKMVVVG